MGSCPPGDGSCEEREKVAALLVLFFFLFFRCLGLFFDGLRAAGGHGGGENDRAFEKFDRHRKRAFRLYSQKPCNRASENELLTQHVISTGITSRQFIGRSRELDFLAERARGAQTRGGIIAVRGDAGVGKTRLLREFTTRAGHDGVRVAAGAVREYANGPYTSLADALAGLGASLPPVQDNGAAGKAAWFASVAESARSAVGSIPTVMTLEDIHWADVSTIDLLRFCAERLAGAPVLFVVTYRGEEIETETARARAIADLERAADVVTLQPLAPGQIEHLVLGILSDGGRRVSASVVADVRDLSDGKPLFAEELLRGVISRLDRDGYADTSVPTSIRATIRERFASLQPGERDVLLHAAVFGRRFSADVVATMLGLDLRVVYNALRHARDLQLIVEEEGEEDDRFAFRHALTREAIYAEMLRAEARIVHGRLAALLAASPRVDPAEIAEHAWRARDAASAAYWNERAGDDAIALYAYAAAARAYDRAFRSTTDEAVRARVAERAADAWYALGDIEQSVQWFGDASDANLRADLPARSARLRLRRARVLVEAGHYDEGFTDADTLARDAHAEPAVRAEADTIAAGLLIYNLRKPLEALERLNGIDADPSLLDDQIRMRILAAYAFAYAELGAVTEARRNFAETIAIADAHHDVDMLVRTHNNSGLFELTYGTLAQAGDAWDTGHAIADQAKNRRLAGWVAQNRCLVAMMRGDLASCAALLEGRSGSEGGVPVVLHVLTAIRLRLATLIGRDDDGLERAALEALRQMHGDRSRKNALPPLLASVLAYRFSATHRPDEAANIVASVAEHLEDASAPYWIFDAVSRFGGPPLRARARIALEHRAAAEDARPAQGFLALFDARENLRRRDRQEAVRLAGVAAETFRATGWRLDEAYALEAAGRIAEALDLFRSFGAEAEVRRLTSVDASPRRRGDSTLTGREREVARLVAAGQTARAIAETLVISERTVESHVASVYRKLGVSNRQELTAILAEASAP